jgi:Protein of unknown function (DUF2853)
MADQAAYLADVQKYDTAVDETAIAGIVKHLGIALRNRDSSLVSCTEKSERDRVRDSWLKKKLGLTAPDKELDAAVQDVCQQMSGDSTKERVTFYYLLAAKFGKLDALH